MIPTGQYNSNDPGFSISIRLTDTDADANFIEFEEVSYFVGNDDPNYRLSLMMTSGMTINYFIF